MPHTPGVQPKFSVYMPVSNGSTLTHQLTSHFNHMGLLSYAYATLIRQEYSLFNQSQCLWTDNLCQKLTYISISSHQSSELSIHLSSMLSLIFMCFYHVCHHWNNPLCSYMIQSWSPPSKLKEGTKDIHWMTQKSIRSSWNLMRWPSCITFHPMNVLTSLPAMFLAVLLKSLKV